MRKYSISPLMLMVMAAFVVIDGTVFSLWTVLSALCHEASHIIALKIIGGRVRSISADAKGFSLKTYSVSYRDEAKIALCGPIVSFVLFLIFLFISRFISADKSFVFLTVSNFVLFALNALPIYPLDCGRALYNLLCIKLPESSARRTARIISYIFLLPLGVLSVIIFLRSGYNVSLLVICVYLLLILTGAFNI